MPVLHILMCVILLCSFKFTQPQKKDWRTELRKKQNPWEQSGQYEGDILLKTSHSDIKNQEQYWPNKELPYEISNAFSKKEKDVILRSLKYVSNKTCIKTIPRRKVHKMSVFFTEQPGYGCSSYVGSNRVLRQPIRLDPHSGCVQFATVVHEILHVLGMNHEHTSYNREEYIIINWQNIIRGKEYNFVNNDSRTRNLGFDYDYDSIMHYDAYAFSVNGMKTIESVWGDDGRLGKTQELSGTDIAKLKTMYGC